MKPTVLNLNVRIFQGQCCHCDNVMDFKPKVEPNGLRCNWCDRINAYPWTEAEYRQVQKDYGQS